MRICIISTYKPIQGSGLGLTEYAYQFELHMGRLIGKNDSIEESYVLDNPKRNNVSGLIKVNTSFKRKLKELSEDDYDIIHITDHEIGFAAKILKKSGNKAKIITTIHDLSRFEKGLHRGISQKLYNRLVSGSIIDAIKYSDFILCNSSQTYDSITKKFGKIKNMKVVLHGTNDRILQAKLQKKKTKNYFTIGYIGALMKHKNVIFILEAAKNLQNNGFRFKIYGTGTDYKMLEDFKERNNLKNVNFLGYLKEKNKVSTYDSFNAFIFPSLYEGLGSPILEAQSRGLPVIIYKYGKIPKEVRKYCFEAESPEHMAQIIEDLKENGYNEKLQKKATEYARTFTWERTAKGTLEVYEKVLK